MPMPLGSWGCKSRDARRWTAVGGATGGRAPCATRDSVRRRAAAAPGDGDGPAANRRCWWPAAATAAGETATRGAASPCATSGGRITASSAYRLVNQPDEIVSVLKNGLAVIAKRVPSPVVSVRGYV